MSPVANPPPYHAERRSVVRRTIFRSRSIPTARSAPIQPPTYCGWPIQARPWPGWDVRGLAHFASSSRVLFLYSLLGEVKNSGDYCYLFGCEFCRTSATPKNPLSKDTSMDENARRLEASLESWRKGVAPVEDVRSLALNLGAYKCRPGIPVLVELMDHKDDMVRYNAAGSLATDFHYVPMTGRLIKMLASDPDDDCRSMAASCLASLCHDTKDHVVLAALANASLEDP